VAHVAPWLCPKGFAAADSRVASRPVGEASGKHPGVAADGREVTEEGVESMRKRIVESADGGRTVPASPWIDVEHRARVELTSEAPGHPVEAALRPADGSGWRAAAPGPQTIRILFDQPTDIRRIRLEFHEDGVARTQEFSLHWSGAGGASREILRQQFTFSPPTTTVQVEDYTVELGAAAVLELVIVPDVGRSDAHASLARWLLG
jgi:hypothetical protein